MKCPVMFKDSKVARARVCKGAEMMRLKSLVKSEFGGHRSVLIGGLLVEKYGEPNSIPEDPLVRLERRRPV